MSVKTSELEAQYAIMFGLALWAEEPPEVDFFSKKLVFAKSVRSKISKKKSKLGRNGSRMEMAGSDLAYMDRE